MLRAACHSIPLPPPLPLPLPALPTNAWTCPACDTARGWLGLARGACGPRARNSPRRPAPRPGPSPGGCQADPARPAPTRGANRLWNRGIARAPRSLGEGTPGFPREGLGSVAARGRCQGGVGAGPKEKLGHAPRGILGANSLIGGACCFCGAAGVTSGQRLAYLHRACCARPGWSEVTAPRSRTRPPRSGRRGPGWPR